MSLQCVLQQQQQQHQFDTMLYYIFQPSAAIFKKTLEKREEVSGYVEG
jgi:hypothetical protein